MATDIERAKNKLATAESHLKLMRIGLQNAQEWLRNAEQLHAAAQRELAEIIKAALPAPSTKQRGS